MGTQVTNAGIKYLARKGTGLEGLTELSFWGKQVTDACLADPAHSDTGLKALTTLWLSGTPVTDAGVTVETVKAHQGRGARGRGMSVQTMPPEDLPEVTAPMRALRPDEADYSFANETHQADSFVHGL